MGANVSINDLPKPPDGKSGWPWTADYMPGNPVALPENVPLVTIVTPSFNQGKYLEETIRSVLLQGYPALEYIIMDGGSTDDSLSIIHKYSKWIDRWVSGPDKGQADAINNGFSLGTGALLGWLNSDDYYLPGGLAKLVTGWIESNADFIHGDVWQAKGYGKPYPWRAGEVFDYVNSLMTLNIPTPQQGTLWTNALWRTVGGLDPKWMCVLDRDFFNKAGLYHTFFYISEPIAVSRTHDDAKSIALQLQWIRELPLMYKEFFRMPGVPSNIKTLKKKTMYAVWQRCAAISRDNDVSAYFYVIRALIESPVAFASDQIRYLICKYRMSK